NGGRSFRVVPSPVAGPLLGREAGKKQASAVACVSLPRRRAGMSSVLQDAEAALRPELTDTSGGGAPRRRSGGWQQDSTCLGGSKAQVAAGGGYASSVGSLCRLTPP